MAKLFDLPEEFTQWIVERPQIKDIFESHPPNLLYKMLDTGHRVTIETYNDNQTVTVAITGEFNLVAFERDVFGVLPSNLEECAEPEEDEEVGVTQTEEETEAMLAALREEYRLARTLQ